MAQGTFFVSWQLWEQMTVVLATGIVIVFCMGLIKLWSSNRHMRKIEQLDAEKQARSTQMRKSGLSAIGRIRLDSDIPFGVKALESGVEVDGIWTAKQASLASQPPNRKWSSRRKRRTPNSLFELSDFTSPSKRGRVGSRASRKAGKSGRRETVEPTHQTQEKLEDMSLLEAEIRPDEATTSEPPPASGQGGNTGPLGIIKRSLKRMKSETWQDPREHLDAGRVTVDVGEFHKQIQAKKPQRCNPTSQASNSTTTPLMAPRARSHVAEHRLDNLLTAHGASRVEPSLPMAGHPEGFPRGRRSIEGQSRVQPANSDQLPAAPQGRAHQSRQRGSNSSQVSSADPFVTSTEEPAGPVRVPGLYSRRSIEHQECPIIPVRRSSWGSEHCAARNSMEVRRSSAEHSSEGPQPAQPPAAQASRYPPNSSRSGPAIVRSQAVGQQPGPGEVYVNACRRQVNEGFDADLYEQCNEQQNFPMLDSGPHSAAASVRSSMDSQKSRASGRRRLQKSRPSESEQSDRTRS